MGDSVAEAPVLRRGFAGGCGPQGAERHFGLLLFCRFFAGACLSKETRVVNYDYQKLLPVNLNMLPL